MLVPCLQNAGNNAPASSVPGDLIKLQEQIIEGYKVASLQKDKEIKNCKHLLNQANKELNKGINKTKKTFSFTPVCVVTKRNCLN